MRKKLEVDEELLERIKKLYGIHTNEAAIDFALRSVLPCTNRQDILELEGIGWDGDLGELRSRNPLPRDKGAGKTV
jgi:Arc/MetJ family transcription regulator